jgi:hypothetical protein
VTYFISNLPYFCSLANDSTISKQFEQTINAISIGRNDLIDVCILMGKSAFEDERIASYAVLNGIGSHKWGAQVAAPFYYCKFGFYELL